MAGAALLRHLGPRLFAAEPVTGLAARGVMPAAARILPARMSSTVAEAAKEAAAPQQRQKPEAAAAAPEGQDKKAVVSYWGIEPRKLVKEDGTEWRWFCFRVSS
jgi:ubiquinol oxidase